MESVRYGRTADLILRAGVAFPFLYSAVDAWFHPDTWLGYFPGFIVGIVPDSILLHGFGAFEIVITLWILSGKRIMIPSAAAALLLLAIVGFHPLEFPILFRDLAIAAAATALAIAHAPASTPRPI